jgi:catalase
MSYPKTRKGIRKLITHIPMNKKLTNEVGAPVSNNDFSVTAGPRGPVVFDDVWLFEKLAHFDREVIPERRMHAKGWGAYGSFTVTHDISKYTKASVLQKGETTDLFLRFSTVAGERGAADAERDIRGVAIKFYTKEGNWDLVGNNTPTFFIRDVHHFPDLNRAVKRDPRTGLHNAENTWDFWTMLPETLHQITITMGDRGIPSDFRHMDIFGEHTYSFINKEGKRVWCKFHLLTEQGIGYLTDEQAEAVVAKDRDSFGRDLFMNIEKGNYPKWKMYVQIMSEEQAKKMPYNPFDITKVWFHKDFPLIEVGELTLNRNPENYFAEVEQAAFTPAHVVPGIGFSPDKFLQGRLFVYGDAQRYRLGVNYNQIPVNRAHVEVHDYSRDGQMRCDGNYGRLPAYAPNSEDEWMASPENMEPPLPLDGAAWRYDPADDPTDNPFDQPGRLYRLMKKDEKERLIANTKRAMMGVSKKVKYRHAVHCYKADVDYGEKLAKALELDMAIVVRLAKLTNKELNIETKKDIK